MTEITSDKSKIVLEEINGERKMKLNYFPHDQAKQIDYVIHYTEVRNVKNLEAERMREKFIKQLEEKEGFITHKIIKKKLQDSNDSYSIYLLLHCSLERLMQEADRMGLELPLKDVIKHFFF